MIRQARRATEWSEVTTAYPTLNFIESGFLPFFVLVDDASYAREIRIFAIPALQKCRFTHAQRDVRLPTAEKTRDTTGLP